MATNLVELPFSAMADQPFNLTGAAQAGPLGFIVLVKVLIDIVGPESWALRFWPLVFSLVSLGLMAAVVKNLLAARTGIVAMAIFASSEGLIYYAANCKQYAGDATVSILMTLLALQIHRHGSSLGRASVFAIAGAIGIWFSHPAVFVIAGAGAALIAEQVLLRQWVGATRLACACTVCAASFFVSYGIISSDIAQNQFFIDWWSPEFAPLPVTAEAATWYPQQFMKMFDHISGTLETRVTSPVALPLAGMMSLAAIVGVVKLFRRDSYAVAILVLPIVLALVASWLGKYPFSGRFLLFCHGSLILLIACSAIPSRLGEEQGSGNLDLLPVVLIALLSFANTLVFKAILIPGRLEIDDAARFVLANFEAGDRVIVYPHIDVNLKFSMDHGSLSRDDLSSFSDAAIGGWPTFCDLPSELPKSRRVWVVVASASDRVWDAHVPALVDAMNRAGVIEGEWVWAQVKVFLVKSKRLHGRDGVDR